MCQSRFVAREFATLKRSESILQQLDLIANLVPLVCLKMLSEVMEGSDTDDCHIIMVALDMKDAFLQVSQEKLVGFALYNQHFVIKRNLSGQHLGAKD